MKTRDLTEPALDWAVMHKLFPMNSTEFFISQRRRPRDSFLYSTRPEQGMPVIEDNKISVWWHEEYDCWCAASRSWMNADVETEDFATMQPAYRGETMLIAGLRCLVASHLGEDVEIPEELL